MSTEVKRGDGERFGMRGHGRQGAAVMERASTGGATVTPQGPQAGEVWRYRDDIPAPWTSFRGTERTVAKREGNYVTWTSGSTEYVSFVVKHAERYIPAPQPAAPTGTPREKPPECAGYFLYSHVDGCEGSPVRLHHVKHGGPVWRSDACYLKLEETIAEDMKATEPKTSQSPRWWLPAIDALGGVRPFGKPRGVR